MISLKNVSNFLDKKYNINSAEEWDNCGTQNFSTNTTNLNKIVVGLDLTTSLLDYAIKNKAQLIITHHPLNFYKDELKEISESPYKKNIFKKLKKFQIEHYVLHTNFDVHKDGMSLAFKNIFKLKNVKNFPKKYGFIVKYKNNQKLSDIIQLFKNYSSWNKFKVSSNYNNDLILKEFAIIPGSASLESILFFQKKGIKVIFTSDIKWNEWITINEEKITIVEILHSVEDVFINEVSNCLKSKFPQIDVLEFEHEKIIKLI